MEKYTCNGRTLVQTMMRACWELKLIYSFWQLRSMRQELIYRRTTVPRKILAFTKDLRLQGFHPGFYLIDLDQVWTSLDIILDTFWYFWTVKICLEMSKKQPLANQIALFFNFKLTHEQFWYVSSYFVCW